MTIIIEVQNLSSQLSSNGPQYIVFDLNFAESADKHFL